MKDTYHCLQNPELFAGHCLRIFKCDSVNKRAPKFEIPRNPNLAADNWIPPCILHRSKTNSPANRFGRVLMAEVSAEQLRRVTACNLCVMGRGRCISPERLKIITFRFSKGTVVIPSASYKLQESQDAFKSLLPVVGNHIVRPGPHSNP